MTAQLCLEQVKQLLKDVLLAHVELYGKTLTDRVKEETGRDYEAVLLEVLAAVDAAWFVLENTYGQRKERTSDDACINSCFVLQLLIKYDEF